MKKTVAVDMRCTVQWQIQDFPDEERQPQNGEHQPIILAIFSQKLYEIEKWTKRRGHISLAAFLNPPMDSSFKIYFRRQSFCDH